MVLIQSMSWMGGIGEATRGSVTAIDGVVALLCLLGQALWITADLWRRRRSVAWWRFGVIFLGPIVLWLWPIGGGRSTGEEW